MKTFTTAVLLLALVYATKAANLVETSPKQVLRAETAVPAGCTINDLYQLKSALTAVVKDLKTKREIEPLDFAALLRAIVKFLDDCLKKNIKEPTVPCTDAIGQLELNITLLIKDIESKAGTARITGAAFEVIAAFLKVESNCPLPKLF